METKAWKMMTDLIGEIKGYEVMREKILASWMEEEITDEEYMTLLKENTTGWKKKSMLMAGLVKKERTAMEARAKELNDAEQRTCYDFRCRAIDGGKLVEILQDLRGEWDALVNWEESLDILVNDVKEDK